MPLPLVFPRHMLTLNANARIASAGTKGGSSPGDGVRRRAELLDQKFPSPMTLLIALVWEWFENLKKFLKP